MKYKIWHQQKDKWEIVSIIDDIKWHDYASNNSEFETYNINIAFEFLSFLETSFGFHNREVKIID